MGIKHTFDSGIADDADATLVRPSDWNDDHVITSFALPGDISPAQIVANTDDWAPTGLADATAIRLSTDALRNLTGITGGADGRYLQLVNVGSFPLVMKNDVTSTAGNRFLLAGLVDDMLLPGEIIQLWYDSTSSRWRAARQVNPITQRLLADHTLSSTTGTEVMSINAIPPGTYCLEGYLIVRSATGTVGPMIGINFTGTAAVKTFYANWADGSTALTAYTANMDDEGTKGLGVISGMATRAYTTAAPNLGTTTGVTTVDVDILMRLSGIFIVTAVGDLEIWHSSETATATSVMAGSSLVLTKTA